MNKPKKLYIERLSNDKYGVKKTHDAKPLVVTLTQEKAIEKAEKMNPIELLVERVRDTKKGGRDKWRKP